MKKTLIWLLVFALLLSGIGFVGYKIWTVIEYRNSHIFVEEAVYAKDAAFLDLRGTGVSLEHYETVKAQLPNCEIRYDLPFQGAFYPDDTRELALTSLTEEDMALLDYLPQLETVDARGCRDYDRLLQLQQRRPDCHVRYTVTVLEQEYEDTATTLSFSGSEIRAEELQKALALLPKMESIHFDQPTIPAEELMLLRETNPQITITWEKDALGSTYRDDVTEIDLSGRKDLTLEQVEQELVWFPTLEKVVMCDCGFDSETMAAFREKMRQQYKVVWSLSINGMKVRTDDTYFMPAKYGKEVTNFQAQQLIYCEDMICVDLGHMNIFQVDWVTGMPHLKYLILADNDLMFIEPLSTCKELVYLELFMTWVNDYTPLLGCTALEDLNVAVTNGDPMVFKQMPWLKNLWVNRLGVTPKEHAELQEALPNTRIESEHGWPTGNGWREVDNYFKMRDFLGMPYNSW